LAQSEKAKQPVSSPVLTETGQPLAERAARAARAELRGERTGILGAIGQSAPSPPFALTRRVPDRWSVIHVPPPQMAI
jgi:hypothetical protein